MFHLHRRAVIACARMHHPSVSPLPVSFDSTVRRVVMVVVNNPPRRHLHHQRQHRQQQSLSRHHFSSRSSRNISTTSITLAATTAKGAAAAAAAATTTTTTSKSDGTVASATLPWQKYMAKGNKKHKSRVTMQPPSSLSSSSSSSSSALVDVDGADRDIARRDTSDKVTFETSLDKLEQVASRYNIADEQELPASGDVMEILPPQLKRDIDTMVSDLISEFEKVRPAADFTMDPKVKLRRLTSDPDIFFQSHRRNLKSYNLLLDAQGQQRDKFLLSQRTFREMQEIYGIVPNAHTYNSMISHCARAGNLERAWQYFNQMAMQGLHIDVGIYGALVNVAAKVGNVKRAFQVLDLMQEARIRPNDVIFTSLIKACAVAGQYDKAVATYHRMQEDRVQPDIITYNLMIRICGQNRDVEKAIDIFNQLTIHLQTPDTTTYANLIYACAQNKEFYKTAFEYYEQMIDFGYTPHLQVYNSLLLATANNRDIANALRLLGEMNSKQAGDVVPNQFSYFQVLRCFATAQRNRTMLIQGKQMSREDRRQMAEEVFREVERSSVPITTRMLNEMLLVYTNELCEEKALLFFHHAFKRHDLVPDAFSYKYLIQMYQDEFKHRKALLQLQRMKRQGIRPREAVFVNLIRSCRRAHDVGIGLEVWDEMRDSGFRLPHEEMKMWQPQFQERASRRKRVRAAKLRGEISEDADEDGRLPYDIVDGDTSSTAAPPDPVYDEHGGMQKYRDVARFREKAALKNQRRRDRDNEMSYDRFGNQDVRGILMEKEAAKEVEAWDEADAAEAGSVFDGADDVDTEVMSDDHDHDHDDADSSSRGSGSVFG